MTRTSFRNLAVETVVNPRLAAGRLLRRDLRRDLLWQGLMLAVVLNALVFWAGIALVPPAQEFPPIMATPINYTLTMAGVALVTVYGLTIIGNRMAGEARLDDVLALVVWLQFMRLAVQMFATILSLGFPGLAAMFAMAVNIYGVWVFANFIDVAHGFGSLLRSFGVIFITGFAVMIALIMALSLAGTSAMGVQAHV